MAVQGALTSGPRLGKRSRALLARARAIDAAFAYEGCVLPQDRTIDGEYPAFARRGEGAYIWDVDGSRYLDFILAYGTIVLGHAHPRVTSAVIGELRRGFAPSLPKAVQVDLAELLGKVIPGAERVLLLKTGSDATSAAVRISRAYTGREHVLRWGYAGWHDWAALRTAGVPEAALAQRHTFTYNDIESLRDVLDAHGHEIACCVMMPFELEPPRPGFLADVLDLVHRHGALLVLDEMRSGFRVALGGAQERLGVTADLATFSKAMANGYPISALSGREDVMSTLGEVHVSSTYYANAAEMAASLATIRALQDGPTLAELERLGGLLLSGLAELAEAAGVPATALGVPQMPFLRFDYRERAACELARRSFFTATVRRGVLLHPNHHWYLSGAMTDADIDDALAACEAGFAAVRRALG